MSGEWISPLNRSTAHINGTLYLLIISKLLMFLELLMQTMSGDKVRTNVAYANSSAPNQRYEGQIHPPLNGHSVR